ncbi:uncharacterized protein TNCV_675941 [Trichonephila clavipes]|nr:uncharacterized protein TNCV_675941 [Trichonephila clavipes]
MALYRSPLTVTLWPSSFLKKYGPMIPPAYKAHQTAWVRCPIPPNTLRVHTEYVLVKSVGPKVLWAESRGQRTGEYFPTLQFHAKIVEVEIGGVAIYRPFREFYRANSCCPLYGAQGQ